MTKLSQIIGAYENKKSTINVVLQDTKKSFSKPERYSGHNESFVPFSVGEDGQTEQVDTTNKPVETTVKTELKFLAEQVSSVFDLALAKEETNSSGRAVSELKINGISFGSYSATTYLALGKMLVQLRDTYNAIPLRDTTKNWSKYESTDKSEKWISEAEAKLRTKKKLVFRQFDDPSGKHPFQVKEYTEDVNIGKVSKIYISGAIDVHGKAMLLQRIDEIIVAVDDARIRANECEAVKVSLTAGLFDYIHKDLFSAES